MPTLGSSSPLVDKQELLAVVLSQPPSRSEEILEELLKKHDIQDSALTSAYIQSYRAALRELLSQRLVGYDTDSRLAPVVVAKD